jgi:thiosulfate/3-mercaptopyruvate sulfurtransferase
MSALASVEELAAHPEWRVFDCRHELRNPDYGRQAYARGHLPGALFLHLDDDLSGPMNGHNGRHPLPDIAAFSRRMADCGVDATTRVLAYDDAGGMFAARLWWLLRWLGHERVAVLDGGLTAWLRAGRTLENKVPTVTAGDFKPRPQPMSVDATQVLANLESRQMLVVDARSADRFRGENETLDPVGGHIPGAVNRCFAENLDAERCCFKPADQLRREYLDLLAGRPATQVVQQCGSGVTACHNLLAMEVAGLPGARLYPGSWSEWCSDSSRPVGRG